jgi:hypothetical protein
LLSDERLLDGGDANSPSSASAQPELSGASAPASIIVCPLPAGSVGWNRGGRLDAVSVQTEIRVGSEFVG